jgi:hypothetical protein
MKCVCLIIDKAKQISENALLYLYLEQYSSKNETRKNFPKMTFVSNNEIHSSDQKQTKTNSFASV